MLNGRIRSLLRRKTTEGRPCMRYLSLLFSKTRQTCMHENLSIPPHFAPTMGSLLRILLIEIACLEALLVLTILKCVPYLKILSCLMFRMLDKYDNLSAFHRIEIDMCSVQNLSEQSRFALLGTLKRRNWGGPRDFLAHHLLYAVCTSFLILMGNANDASNTPACMQDPHERSYAREEPLNDMDNHDAVMEITPTISTLGTKRKSGLHLFIKDISYIFKLDELGREIARMAIPAALALAADPLASLADTAFIGRLGSVELAAVGVSIAIFNQVSKVAIYPLVSVTTSFVAEEDAICFNISNERDLQKASTSTSEMLESASTNEVILNISEGQVHLFNGSLQQGPSLSKEQHKRNYIPSVPTALIVGGMLGLLQAILLSVAAKVILGIMGVKPHSPMLAPALQYLMLRSLGAPAILLSLAMQGVFRGFKDTKTPLYAIVAGDLINIILDPILIFICHMGVRGAAIAHVASQYVITFILLCKLIKQVDIVPPSIASLKFSRFFRCGFLLLTRVIAVTFCVTLAASLAAHHGSTPMAAFQTCLQVWLSSSLLADGLAVAGQAILATACAKGDLHKVAMATSRVLQLSIALGLVLSVLLSVGLQFGSGIFTKDTNVVKVVHKAIPFVAGTQVINSLAFVFDGINFGVSDYAFSAYSMVAVAAISIPLLIFLSSSHGFIGIWVGLTIYMGLRTFASLWRMGSATGPWSFLRK
ncbi:hypothetical protein HPP92_019952 [Vanilla planifolia]|uniref:Protein DETOXIFICATION n=1 Tax=Vanilla planifolia TaxID=51239 RepID=A0A835ULF3_VANPL|nr:hypothetical protein HPP92_019952 [Vanilla planifolia]